EMSPPMDVLWFRLSRHEGDPEHSSFSLASGHVVGLINRSTYWQVAYIIPKGTEQHVHEAGLEQLKQALCAQQNWMQDRIDELQSWEQIKLLVVQSNRLTRWYRPGLLCIGDAAHAMTPVGGVGINLAIQDAVAAANILAEPLKRGQLRTQHLAAVQRRREWPTRIIQLLQTTIQKRLASSAFRAAPVAPLTMGVLRVLNRLNLPARLIGFGVWPAHVKS
ncbi:MAG TPA: FAD-dependent monooxygenase, partial [Ktedonobacteraceae bacterium]|nr:FAD-dependent monooxygenase [Ktedonobacteraceae bacterium]